MIERADRTSVPARVRLGVCASSLAVYLIAAEAPGGQP
jgi:hypothetical protein